MTTPGLWKSHYCPSHRRRHFRLEHSSSLEVSRRSDKADDAIGFFLFFTRCLGVSFRRAREEKQQTTLAGKKERRSKNNKDKVISKLPSLSLSLSLSLISFCLLHALHRKPFLSLSLSLYVNYYTLSLSLSLSLLLFLSLSLSLRSFFIYFLFGDFFFKNCYAVCHYVFNLFVY